MFCKQAANFLEENSRIGLMRRSYIKRRHCITLRLQQIFDQLVNLYASLFLSCWQDCKSFMKPFPFDRNHHPDAWTHAARVYVSTWIHDLYVSNRKDLRRICSSEFLNYYRHEEVYFSCVYDEFLVRLNAAIRPTTIRGTMDEDAVYVPVFYGSSDSVSWNPSNPFEISDFVLDRALFSGLVDTMSNSNRWSMRSLVNDNGAAGRDSAVVGRPSWLFDWHEGNECCAWFPSEGNYTMDDVCVAYIVGAACSPNLGPRDVDEWRPFPKGTPPEKDTVSDYERVVERNLYGAHEVRTVEQRRVDRCCGCKKVKLNEEGGQCQAAAAGVVYECRVIDWTYYELFVFNFDLHSRPMALRLIAMK